MIDRVIFEGATAQLRVDVGGRELRADVAGSQRLTLVERSGRVRLGFDDITLIAASAEDAAQMQLHGRIATDEEGEAVGPAAAAGREPGAA